MGDKKFAAAFDSKIKFRSFRHINNEDIVTRVPTRNMGYEHIGNVFYFDSFGHLSRGIQWWREFLDVSFSTVVRALDRFQELKEQFPNGLEDHSMDRYISLIEKNS